MNAGIVKSTSRGLLLAGLVSVLLVVSPAALVVKAVAQTPNSACNADSLYLISPSVLDVRLETVGKPGVTISWPNLDQSQSTCFSLNGDDNLGFGVAVDGGFGDKVDRLIGFSTDDTGLIGGQNAGSLTFNWQTEGGTENGILAGQFNLSNNSGFWSYGQSGWQPANTGLPMIWPYTNVVGLGVGSGGFMVAGFTGGTSTTSDPKGLYAYNGTNWDRIRADIFSEDVLINAVVVSQQDNDSFAVGTDRDGLFVTDDGGVTFTQWTLPNNAKAATKSLVKTQNEHSARYLKASSRSLVTALNWDSDRLLVYFGNGGLFISNDGAASFEDRSFTVPDNLDVPQPEFILPTIRDFAIDPADSNRIVAALLFQGAYESSDGGVNWHNLNGDLVVSVPDEPGAWINSALSVVIDPGNPQIIIMAVKQRGLYRTADGGITWSLVGEDQGPSNRAALISIDLLYRPGIAGEVLAMEDKWKLLHSTDSGLTWSAFDPQPALNKALVIASLPGGNGEFILGGNGGGIYEAGSTLNLADSYGTGTSPELRGLDLGLTIAFDQTNGGVVNSRDSFELVAQTFQGWAVWRGPRNDPENLQLIGLFDLVNPEDCFAGFCGDNSLEIIPSCFAAKRAACFNLSDLDTLRFFDDEIYNGFSYVYSVTSFDYGNLALITPQNNTNEMLFSPRYTGDKMSIYVGPGNRVAFDVNKPATGAEHGDDIYAYPNPIRLGVGVPRGEGRLVVFTNLPDGSRVRVFTTAGDDIIDLGPDNQTAGQIYWDTANWAGEDIAAGVYLYKVEMPQREDFWGRIVVIR